MLLHPARNGIAPTCMTKGMPFAGIAAEQNMIGRQCSGCVVCERFKGK
jgi:hypothetical protein